MRQRSYEQIILFLKMSMGLNLIIAVGRLMIGIYSMSVFLCINALYGASMGLARFVSLRGYNESNKPPDAEHPHGYGRLEYRYYYLVGLILLAGSIAYMIYCIRMFIGHKSPVYSMNVAIAIATFTFTELVLSIRGAIITRKNRKPIFEAIKLINLASSLILLSLTQTAILSFTMEGEDMSFYNGLGGVIMGALAALIGLYMVTRMQRIITGKNRAYIEKKTLKIIKKYIPDMMNIEVVNYEDYGPGSRKIYIRISNDISAEMFAYPEAVIQEKLHSDLVKITGMPELFV